MKKVIFDCDNTMGVTDCDVDDGLALIYLLGKGVDIGGITTTYGNSDIETVYANTSKMLKELGRSDIPLLKGCANRYNLKSEAADFIVETVHAHKGNISILATGSLTNLYAAYNLDNAIFDQVSEVVLMGGITQELIINGKVLDELNFACDPVAAACILKNARNLSIITGNNCLNAFFTDQEFKSRLGASDRPIGHYISQKCSYWFENMMARFNLEGFHNWDVVAVAYFVNPSLFEDAPTNVTPNLEKLQRGLITHSTKQGELSNRINIPIIHNLTTFTDDVYEAWLNFDLSK